MTEQTNEHLLNIKYETLVLLKERGYVIPSEEASILDKTIKMSDFKAMYYKIQNDSTNPLYSYFNNNLLRVSMSNIYYKDGHKCLVYFAESTSKEKKISTISVTNFCRIIATFDITDAIIISVVPSNNAMDSLLSDCIKKQTGKNVGVFIQFFLDDELMYNPLKHNLVPKHRIITKKEKEELTEVDKINIDKLPQISVFDPICKRMGSRVEDVIEIIRRLVIKDTLIDEEITYRYVVMSQIDKNKK